MPWTAETFKSRHNHSLSPEAAAHAAAVANSVLKRTGDEGRAVAAGNAAAKQHAKKKSKKRAGVRTDSM